MCVVWGRRRINFFSVPKYYFVKFERRMHIVCKAGAFPTMEKALVYKSDSY